MKMHFYHDYIRSQKRTQYTLIEINTAIQSDTEGENHNSTCQTKVKKTAKRKQAL